MAVETKAPEFMTTDEAAQYLQMSRPTLYKWINAGKLMPFNFVEGKIRQPKPLYRKSDLDAFIAARRQERLARQTTHH